MTEAVTRVLVVEDNPDDAELLRVALTMTHAGRVEVTCAERLSEGVAALSEDPSVVFLDLSLPDSRGLQTFHRMHERAPHVPIIILSGVSDATLAVEAVRCGAQDYLVKGEVDHRLLTRAVRYAIERQRREDEVQALASLGRELADTLDIAEIRARITSTTLRLLRVRRVILFDAEPKSGRLTCRATAGTEPDEAWVGVTLPGDDFIALAIGEGSRLPALPGDDERLAPWLRSRLRAYGYGALAAVPIAAQRSTLGALVVADAAGRTFSDRDIRLLTAFADQAALAMTNAELYATAERRRWQAEEVARLTRSLTETLEVSAVAERTVHSVLPLFGLQSSVLRLRHADGSLRRLAAAGVPLPGSVGSVFAPGAGLAGQVAATGRPVWRADIQEDDETTLTLPPGFRRALVDIGYRSVLVAPLRAKDRIIGTLSIAGSVPRDFDPHEVELLQTCADAAALALDNALVSEDRERRRREAEVIAHVARSIGGSLDVDIVLQRIADAAIALCGADHASIALRSPGEDAAYTRYWTNEERAEFLPIWPGRGMGGLALATGQPQRTADYAKDPRFSAEYASIAWANRIVAQLVIPIPGELRVDGLLYLARQSDTPFSDGDEAAALRLADHAAIAIRNAESFAREQAARAELQDSERALRESEGRLRRVVESAVLGVVFWRSDGTITDANQAFLEMIGWSEADLASGIVRWDAMTPAEYRAVDEQALSEISATGVCRTFEKECIRKDGSRVPVLVGAAALDEGRDGGVAFVVDISERRRGEAVARQLAAIVESSHDAIISRSLDGTVLSWNRGAEQMFGYAAAEMIGRPISTVVAPDSQALIENVTSALLRGEALDDYEAAGLHKDGRRLDVSLTVSPIRNAAGEVVAGSTVARDVTERKRAAAALQESEERLRQAYKMEAIGRLAGGIAHDFNNLLTVIVGRAHILDDKLPADSALRRSVHLIQRTAERAGGLTRQLLAFSRKQVLQPRVLDMNAVLISMNEMLRRIIGEDIEVVLSTDPDAGCVKADPAQLEQVILNLAVNARDAMPTGGRLVLSTGRVTFDAAAASRRPGARAGAYVVLEVSDTGFGMDEATRARIFEPFFTTKERGHGTGLGLATVFGIVEQSDGYISVASEPGHGATFTIHLPRVEAPADVRGGDSTAPVRGGSETIMLTEDEADLRDLGREVLQSAGYTVLTAADGAEALAVAQGYAGRIDLLVTDVIMPRMSGPQLAQAFGVRHPETRVGFVSGYPDDIMSHHGVLPAGTLFLAKPFTAGSLLRWVREVLDTRENVDG